MSTGAGDAKVLVDLVINSDAKDELADIKKEITGLGNESGKLKKFLSTNVDTLKAFKSSGAVQGLMAVGSGAIAAGAAVAAFGGLAAHAFLESEQQVRELAGTFSVLDEAGYSLDRIHDYASETKDELEALGMAAGVADDELVAVFNDVIERGGKSVEEAKELTRQMAFAGRAIPGGAAALSGAFEQLQMGIVKAKNPIVGMIASTHMLKGNAKQVAKEMAKMTPDEQLALAEKAIGRMSQKMEKAPMTLAQMGTSMQVFAGNLMEGVGQPIVEKLGTAFASVRGKFFNDDGSTTALADKLTKAASQIGDFLSGGIELASAAFDEFWQTFSGFSANIAGAWNHLGDENGEIFETWKSALKTGADIMGVVLGQLVVNVGRILQAFKAIYNFVTDMTKGLGNLIAAGLKAVGANDIGQDLENFTREGDKEKALKNARLVGGGDINQLRADFMRNADTSTDAKTKTAMEDFDRALSWRKSMEQNIEKARGAAGEDTTNVGDFLAAYNEAVDKGDEAAQKSIVAMLGQFRSMADAIGEQGPELLGEGKRKFLEQVKEMAGDKTAAGIAEKWKPKIGDTAKHQINFNGGQTFHIKQDFKEVDPDRIAFLMNGDIMRSAIDRMQTNTVRNGSAF